MAAALVIYTLNSSTIFGVNFDSIFFSLSLLLFLCFCSINQVGQLLHKQKSRKTTTTTTTTSTTTTTTSTTTTTTTSTTTTTTTTSTTN